MNTTKYAIAAMSAVLATATFAGDFDLYLQVRDAWAVRATNEVAQTFLNDLTDEQWLEFTDQYIATNAILHEADGKMHGGVGCGLGTTNGEFWLGWKIVEIGRRRGNAKELADIYDQKFLDAGIPGWFPWDFISTFYPKVNTYYAENVDTNAAGRMRASFAVRMACRDSFDENGWPRKDTIPERINNLVNRKVIGADNIEHSEQVLKSIVGDATKPIKRKLREKGISFVVSDDGVNPVQDAIDALTAAFQAPKLAGVKEWVAEWFPEYTWIDLDDLFLADDKVAELCDDVYYGEKELTPHVAIVILTHIGLSEYNKFVERYNGKTE